MSNHDAPDSRVEAYLSGELSRSERRRFESELKKDPALRRELKKARLIDRILTEGPRVSWRRLLGEVRSEVGPIPPPRISLWDRLRAAFGKRWALGIVSVLLLILLSQVVPPPIPCPTTGLVDKYFLSPTLVHVQAGEIDRNLAFRASMYYGDDAHEELAKLTTASREITPLYYLAHDYLRLDDYSRAESTFDRLLEQSEALTAYAEYQDLDQLRFNRLLSRFGMNEDPRATLQALDSLLADPALAETETGERAQALADELGSTWGWWACR